MKECTVALVTDGETAEEQWPPRFAERLEATYQWRAEDLTRVSRPALGRRAGQPGGGERRDRYGGSRAEGAGPGVHDSGCGSHGRTALASASKH